MSIPGVRPVRPASTRRMLELASAVASDLASALLPGALQRVADHVRSALGCEAVYLFLPDRVGGLALQAAAGPARAALAAGDLAPGTVVARAAVTGEPTVVDDLGADARVVPHPLLDGQRSELAVPLLAGGAVRGVLDATSERPAAFEAADIDLLAAVGGQVIVAVEGARRSEELLERLRELESQAGRERPHGMPR